MDLDAASHLLGMDLYPYDDIRTDDDFAPPLEYDGLTEADVEGERYEVQIHADRDIRAIAEFVADVWPDLRVVFTDHQADDTDS